MKLKNLFTLFFILGILLLVSMGFIAYQALQNRYSENQEEDFRFKANELADELNEGVENLSTFSRNYISSGDTLWEMKYYDMLDIRKGTISRDKGKINALLDSLKNLGLTTEELEKLQEAENYLTELIKSDRIAINAVKGKFDDGSKHFLLTGKPDADFAEKLLYSVDYLAAKTRLKNTIYRFIDQLHQRRTEALRNQTGKNNQLLYILIGLILLLISLATASFIIMKGRIIGHLEELDGAYSSLRGSEDKFRHLFELSPIGMALIDENSGRFLEVNEAALRASGYSRKEFLNFTFKEMSPSENRNRIEIYTEYLMKDGRFGPAESELIHKDGSRYPIKLSAHRIKETSGRKVIWCIIEDVTAIKMMERSLQINHERFFVMLSNLLSGLLVVTEEGRVEFVNKSFCKIFNLSCTPQELVGLSSSEVKMIIKDSFAEPENAIARIRDILFAGEEVIGEEVSLKEGKICRRDYIPLFINNKRYGRLWNHQDITEQKKAESTLQYERTLLRTVIDNIPDLIYAKDLKARKTLANKADIKLMGIKNEEEAIGKDDTAFYPPEQAKEFIDEDMGVISSGNPALNTQGCHYDEFGKWHWYMTSKYPLRNSAGNLIGLVGIGRDITDHKLREMELEKHLERQTSLVSLLQSDVSTVQEFLDRALEEAIKITESKIGYIYHYNEQKREFVLNSWSKDVMKECSIMDPQTCYELDKTGIWGEAVRQRKEIIVNDFQATHPLKKGYPDGHVTLRKYLTIPLFKGEQIVAVVGVANKESDYDENDVMQLQLLMSTIWERVFSIKAQTALRKSEARLKEAQTIAHVGNWELDLSTQLVSGSGEAANIYGVLVDELSLDVVQQSVVHQYRSHLDEALRDLLTGKNNYDEIFQIKRIDNDSIRWVHSKAELVTSPSGEPLRITGTIQDITDLKVTEEALVRSEEQLKLVIQGSGVGSWDWQVQGTELVVNERWAEICGYTLNELQPVNVNTWIELVHPDDLLKSNELLQKHFAGESDSYECEARMKHKSGNWVWVLDRGKVVEWDEKGNPIRMSGTHLDITDRKIAEAKLKQYAEELEELNQTKDKFFSIIAHDLRNPFGLIINYAEFIQEKAESMNDEELKEDIEAMYISAKRVYSLLENLLEWARIQNKNNKLNVTSFNVTNVLESQIELYKDILKEKNIKVHYDVDTDISINADKNQIETVFRNLVSNAVKFTPIDGSIQLSVQNTNHEKQNYVKIIITDNGVGMSEEEVQNLFKIGRIKTKVGTAGETGTGFGLGLCKEFVEKNQGEISVESKLGRGTTFVVSLPQINK